MRYRFKIRENMAIEEVDSILQEQYHYPLLNFAYVISDVIAESTIFSEKKRGRKKSEIKAAISTIEKIQQILRKEQNLFIPDSESDSLLGEIDRVLNPLRKDLSQFHYEHEAVKKHLPMPHRKEKARPIKKGNQICYFWAFIMKSTMKDKKERIHWEKMLELLEWFYSFLNHTTYWSEKNRVDDKESLEVMYYNIRKRFYMILQVVSHTYYFPFKEIKPGKPNIPQEVSGGGIFLFPMISVKFYKDKIKTVFEENDKLKVRETFLEQNKCYSKIRDYSKDEEKYEKDNLLLEIF